MTSAAPLEAQHPEAPTPKIATPCALGAGGFQVPETSVKDYNSIAVSLSNVAVFAGGFTLNNLLATETPPSPTLLSIAFVLFSSALFIGIWVQFSLRRGERGREFYSWKDGLAYFLLGLMGTVMLMGFILLSVVVVKNGNTVAGAFGIGLVSVVASLIFIELWQERKTDALALRGLSRRDCEEAEQDRAGIKTSESPTNRELDN